MTRLSFLTTFWLIVVGLMMGLGPGAALAGTELGGADVGFLEKAVVIMQNIVNFFEGPFGIFVAVVALALAIGVWVASSRGDGELGWIGRAVIGAMLLINITAIISNLRSG